MKKIYLIALASLTILFSGCFSESKVASQGAELSPKEVTQIAKEAYIYGFPLVLNYKTMYEYAVDKKSPEYKADFNQLACVARVYTPEDRTIVTPNSDTPYCMTWVDMRAEPVVFTIPEIEKKRFYEVQLIDLYTHNAAYISTVATGNVPGKYLLVGPDWKGKIPKGITKVIPFETQFLFSIHRTQLFNPSDIENLKTIQEAYKVEPLHAFLGTSSPAAPAAIDFPKWKSGDEFNAQFFKYLDFMLTLVKTPDEEQALMKRFAKIGIDGTGHFELKKFSPEMQKALEEGVKEGLEAIKAFGVKASKDSLSSAKVFGTRAFLNKSAKDNYQLENMFMIRAVAAQLGLYGNSGEEAIYPTYLTDAEGTPMDASKNNYTMTFKKGELPPVSAFWSLTMYDGKTQLLVDNPLNRYLLNSPMIDSFVFGEDGSLTLYVQKESPGKALESNWLPAPNGPFYAIMRLYGPKKEALEGQWVAPKLVKVLK
ncbi:MAG TPA: DUF1254 domain-containing protein [Epsilonproteobacteria bacterium]|nr:DUF1254 domain-containing protein [Campylobacterota bacterium]